jgi:hypothetical protein
MGRRNKKRVTGVAFPAPFAVGVLLVSCLAMVYVWLGGRGESLGKELKGLELEKRELNKKLLAEEFRWARVKSPSNVEQALARHGISMSWPRKDQIMRLSDSDMKFDQRSTEVAKGAMRVGSEQKSL